MKMKNILLLLVVLLTFSCQKVVDINPKTGDQKVIVQSCLYKDSLAYVIVTKSTDYLSKTKPVSLSGAIVTLTNNHGASEILTWNSLKRVYEGNTIRGVANDFYTLQVTFEGKTYTASSVLPDLVPADTIIVKKNPATSFNEESYTMKLYATLPSNVDLYFLFKGYSNGVFLNDVNDIYYADNKLLNGSLEGVDIGYEYSVGDTAKLELMSLTKEAYNFYDAASIQLNNDGGFFSTPPANVPSMFNNGAVGLFQCSTIQVLTTVVQAQ